MFVCRQFGVIQFINTENDYDNNSSRSKNDSERRSIYISRDLPLYVTRKSTKNETRVENPEMYCF